MATRLVHKRTVAEIAVLACNQLGASLEYPSRKIAFDALSATNALLPCFDRLARMAIQSYDETAEVEKSGDLYKQWLSWLDSDQTLLDGAASPAVRVYFQEIDLISAHHVWIVANNLLPHAFREVPEKYIEIPMDDRQYVTIDEVLNQLTVAYQ